MKARRLAALSAAAVLLVLSVARNSPAELARRVRFLARTARSELAVRRLAGSGTAFDRSFYAFLESIRRKLPRGTAGVAILTPRPSTQARYLATYVLAPVPVLLAPDGVPPRWLAAFYSAPPPAGWRVVASVPGGTLAARE